MTDLSCPKAFGAGPNGQWSVSHLGVGLVLAGNFRSDSEFEGRYTSVFQLTVFVGFFSPHNYKEVLSMRLSVGVKKRWRGKQQQNRCDCQKEREGRKSTGRVWGCSSPPLCLWASGVGGAWLLSLMLPCILHDMP